jgi:protein phosphatase
MIPAERSHLHVAAKSHPGMSGKNNEDRYGVSAYRLSHEDPLPVVFAIVSDGIGGHHAGEVAAEMAVDIISQHVAASDGSSPVVALENAIIKANESIVAQSERNPQQSGMGATCACCWIIDDRLYIAYLGDSRVYLLREGRITQISADHTWVQEAVEIGLLTPEETIGHPNAHVIRRYLGSPKTVEPDTRLHLDNDESSAQAENNQGMKLLPGDQVFLCSDGLTDLVGDEEILSHMESKSLDGALGKLISLANERGGHDNITIISMRVPTSAPRADYALPGARRWKTQKSCLVVGLLLLISIFIFAGAYLFWNYGLTSPVPTAERTPTEPLIFPPPQETIETATPTPPIVTESPSPSTAAPTLTSWPVTPASPDN